MQQQPHIVASGGAAGGAEQQGVPHIEWVHQENEHHILAAGRVGMKPTLALNRTWHRTKLEKYLLL